MPLYVVRIDIFEPGVGTAYPVVTHAFHGRSRREAWRYANAHRRADAFLRECQDRGTFGRNVRCRARVSEGWIAERA